MSAYPRSPTEMTGGMMLFPRMLDKIRMHARGDATTLRTDIITIPELIDLDEGRRN